MSNTGGGSDREPASVEAATSGIEALRAYGDVLSLAREATSKAQYLKGLPAAVAPAFGSPYAAVYARLSAEVVEGRHCAEESDRAFWKRPVDAHLTGVLENARPSGRVYRSRDAAHTVAVLASPLRNADGGLAGALALVAPCSGEEHARTLQRALESIAHLASCYGVRFDIEPDARGNANTPSARVGRAREFDSIHELAFAIVNNLRNHIGAEQVSLGLERVHRVEVLAISGYDEVNVESAGVSILRAAMEECSDVGARAICQTEPNAEDPVSTGHRIHRQWHEESGGGAVASLPFPIDDDRTLVLCLRRAATEPFTREDLAHVEEQLGPYVDAFALVERASRSLATHAADAVRGVWRAARQRQHANRTAAAVFGGLAFLWFCFGTVDYRISAPATVVPSSSRHLSAPFEGTLAEVSVTAGERVSEGQVLAALDREELVLERDRLRAELVASRLASGRAMVGRAAVDVRAAQAQEQLLRARIDTLDARIQVAEIRAPFDGLVVSGDQRKRVGQRVPLGETLFELAPETGWVIELEVPEHAAADLAVGLVGSFASHARPDESRRFEIARITPSAEARDGRNVYVAEARVELEAAWIRAGVQGIGKIEVGSKPAWWSLVHRVTDSLWLHFWL